tara:strand:- start:6790 stop:12597 length:5808 start_codon:yes stop_codon:yes gene_type:complete
MTKIQRNFAKGIMNKSTDERLVPNGEYIDALNVRLGSTELSEIGSVELTKGNTKLTTIAYPETGLDCSTQIGPLSVCVGAYSDEPTETIYWFVHDPKWTGAAPAGSPTSVITSGNATSAAPNLIDGGANFVTDGIQVGDIVKNTVTLVESFITAVAATELKCSTPFLLGEGYQVLNNTQRLDLIVSYNTKTNALEQHVVSVWDGVACSTQRLTTLNFNPRQRINAINKVGDLLFFTDNYNAPRKINVTASYAPPTVTVGPPCELSADNFTNEEILVIKKPPFNCPTITFSSGSTGEATQKNYLEERFICFATRFKYADGEYSATSPFSEPAFVPKDFFLAPDSLLNDGMTNYYNQVNISFSTGSSLVKEVEVLFKESDDPVVRVLEKLDKGTGANAISNNSTHVISFDNSKIYTILEADEILRLYDNVPRFAKAQTFMGNRLVYGNYVEGYNLVDKNNNLVKPQFEAVLSSSTANSLPVATTLSQGEYNTYVFGVAPRPQPGTSNIKINNSILEMDFTDVPLNAGSVITISFDYMWVDTSAGDQYFKDNSSPANCLVYDPGNVLLNYCSATPGSYFDWAQQTVPITFTYTLTKNYANAEELLNDPGTNFHFLNALGGPAGTTAASGLIADVLSATDAIQTPPNKLTDLLYGRTLGAYTFFSNPPSLWAGFTKYVGGHSLPLPSATQTVFTQETQALSVYMTSGSTDKINIKMNPVMYIQNVTNPSDVEPCLGIFPRFKNPNVRVESSKANRSLHSNRGYEIGMAYMDEYGRSTTPLQSPNNTVSTTCAMSDLVNKITVKIPSGQFAPSWATHYKFYIKPDREDYITIFSTRSYVDSKDGSAWFLLAGENATKIEVGDELVVKKDAAGPVSTCEYCTVASKEAKPANFIAPINVNFNSTLDATDSTVTLSSATNSEGETVNMPDGELQGTGTNPQYLAVPAGVYMQIKNPNFTLSSNSNPPYPSLVQVGSSPIVNITQTETASDGCPILIYKGLSGTPTSITGTGTAAVATYSPFSIPPGTVVKISFRFERRGGSVGERIIYTYNQEWKANTNYTDIIDFWDSNNIAASLNLGSLSGTGCPNGVTTSMLETINTGVAASAMDDISTTCTPCEFYFRWHRNPDTNEISLCIKGGEAGGTLSTASKVTAVFDISFEKDIMVFETTPSDALPNIWYEDSKTYTINTTTGGHNSGNSPGDQNQIPGSPGIDGYVELSFFNCFAFGNGVESYKIKDSIVSKSLKLGNRVTSTTTQEYKEAHRFADLTYSGVINDESNINKLNEFNLGLLNFKPLEDSFGSIEVLSGRKGDILVLQEDKISYVLAGKNLISDSTGGGTIASVPEVLGTQIARLEQYGISNNPESFVVYGYDKFFTDSKRGAVIRLRGSSAQNEELNIISDFGMSSWFRDSFLGKSAATTTATDPTTINSSTQKLGGYDPYMNEYVVSLNDQPIFRELLPDPCDSASGPGDNNVNTGIPIEDCGTTLNFSTESTSIIQQGVDLGTTIGTVNFVVAANEIAYTVSLTYNNTVVAGPTLVGAGTSATLSFVKSTSLGANGSSVSYLSITPSATTPGNVSIETACASETAINVIVVWFNSKTSANQIVEQGLNNINTTTAVRSAGTYQWQWSDGADGNGPLTGQQVVEFGADIGAVGEDITSYTQEYHYNEFPLSDKDNGWNDVDFMNLGQGVTGPPDGSTFSFKMQFPSNTDNTWWDNSYYWNVDRNKVMFLRTNTTYAKTATDAKLLLAECRNAGNPNSGVIGLTVGTNLISENLPSQGGVPTQNDPAITGEEVYVGTFTVPTPGVAMQNLYIVVDATNSTEELMCQSTSAGALGVGEAACECYSVDDPCGAGNFVCYKFISQSSNFAYNYNVTTPTGAALHVAPANSPPNQYTVTYACSSTFPELITDPTNLVNINGAVEPIPIIAIECCGNAVGCAPCSSCT